jgi:hypothetical protein
MALKRLWLPSPNYSSRGGATVRLIVLHTSEGAQDIRSLGNFFANPSSQVSSHVGIDNVETDTIGEYVKRGNKAWTAASANPIAVQVEQCTPSGAASGWSRDYWLRTQERMLRNTARWIAEEAKHYGIPIVELTPSQAQGGGRGVCQHVDLGSMGGDGHTDCGKGYPMDQVLAWAKGGDSGEDDDMPGWVRVSATYDQPLKAGEGKSLSFDHESSDVDNVFGDENPSGGHKLTMRLTGAKYVSTLTLTADDGVSDGTLWTSLADWDGKQNTQELPWKENPGTSGTTSVVDTRAGRCGDNKEGGLRVWVKASTDCKITAAQWYVLYW